MLCSQTSGVSAARWPCGRKALKAAPFVRCGAWCSDASLIARSAVGMRSRRRTRELATARVWYWETWRAGRARLVLSHPPLPLWRASFVPSRVVVCTCASPAETDSGSRGASERRWTQMPGLDLAGAAHIQPIAVGNDLMWERKSLSRGKEHDANLLDPQGQLAIVHPQAQLLLVLYPQGQRRSIVLASL